MHRRTTAGAAAFAAACLGMTEGAAAAPGVETARGGAVVVAGSDGDDALALRVRGLALEIDRGDDGSVDTKLPLHAVRRLRVETGAGDDRVRIDDGPWSLLRFTPVTVDGGDGYDVVAASGSPASQRIALEADGAGAELERHAFGAGIALRGVEQVDAAADGGADSLQVGDLSGTGLLQVGLDLGEADGRADAVEVALTDEADFVETLASGASVFVIGPPALVQVNGTEPHDAVTVDGRGGDDNLSASTATGEAVAYTALGGPGDDALRGGRGADHLAGGPGADSLFGDDGADRLALGSGDDAVSWDPGDGSDDVEGRGGDDSLLALGSTGADAFALTRDGAHATLAAPGAELALRSVETIETVAQTGADTFDLGDLTGTAVRDVRVSLSGVLASPATDGVEDRLTVAGTAGDDAFVVSGDRGEAAVDGLPFDLAVQRTEPADAVALLGGAGADTLDASGLAPGAFAVTLTD